MVAVAGLCIGMLLGTGLALAVWLTPFAAGLLTMPALLVQSTPLVALLPVIARMLGYGEATVVAAAALITFLPTFVFVGAGLLAAPLGADALFSALGSSRLARLRYLAMPAAIPKLLLALRVAAPNSLLAALVAEYLIGTIGLGRMFADSQVQLLTAAGLGVEPRCDGAFGRRVRSGKTSRIARRSLGNVMKRRTFVASAAAGISLMARRADALTAVTTQLQWVKDVQYGGFWLAEANGYFRNAGIASTILAGGSAGSSIEALLTAGRADVGIDLFERVVEANADGADLVVIGALYQKDPSCLLSLPGRPVRTAHDIIGKRLGLQQGARPFIDAIMKLNHLPPDYTEVVVGFDPEPLLQGACDAYLCFVVNTSARARSTERTVCYGNLR